jgi:small redox-active disulfide protein 2
MSSLTIEVLGTGCKKCQQLEANVQDAIASLNLDADVQHITDAIEIAKRGIMSTPTLVIDGKIVSQGKLLSAQQVKALLQA